MRFSVQPLFNHVVTLLLLAFLVGSSVPYIIFLISWMIISIPLPESWFHKVEDGLWGTYQRLVVFLYEHYSGVEVYIDGVIPPMRENVLVISNHQCLVDWIVADFLAVRQNMTGHMRYVFKNSLKYYWLYGFAFGVHGGVFVRRDGKYNMENMKRVLQKLIKRKASLYFLVYPEGTRFSPNPNRKAILEKSQDFATKNGLKPLHQVLFPRVKAFDCALDTLYDYIDAVYDLTIIYTGFKGEEKGVRHEAPQAGHFLSGSCKRIYITFRRIPIGDVKSSVASYEKYVKEGKSATMLWLYKRFKLKDDLITSFFEAENIASFQGSGAYVNGAEEKLSTWKRSFLPFSSTLPSLLFFLFIHFVFLYFPTGRFLYTATLTIGTIVCMVYSHFSFS